jgi:hypothetical protein
VPELRRCVAHGLRRRPEAAVPVGHERLHRGSCSPTRCAGERTALEAGCATAWISARPSAMTPNVRLAMLPTAPSIRLPDLLFSAIRDW